MAIPNDLSIREIIKATYPLERSDINKGMVLGVPVGLVAPTLGATLINNLQERMGIRRHPRYAEVAGPMLRTPLGLNYKVVARMGFHTLVWAPTFEEIAFRGLIQRNNFSLALRTIEADPDSLQGRVGRVAATSTLFALCHYDSAYGNWRMNLRRFPQFFIAGAVFGGLAEATGNLWAATFAHTANNVLALTVALSFARRRS